MPLIFKNNKLLFVGGKLAMNSNCCCNECVCPCFGGVGADGLPSTIVVTFSGLVDPGGFLPRYSDLNGSHTLTLNESGCFYCKNFPKTDGRNPSRPYWSITSLISSTAGPSGSSGINAKIGTEQFTTSCGNLSQFQFWQKAIASCDDVPGTHSLTGTSGAVGACSVEIPSLVAC